MLDGYNEETGEIIVNVPGTVRQVFNMSYNLRAQLWDAAKQEASEGDPELGAEMKKVVASYNKLLNELAEIADKIEVREDPEGDTFRHRRQAWGFEDLYRD